MTEGSNRRATPPGADVGGALDLLLVDGAGVDDGVLSDVAQPVLTVTPDTSATVVQDMFRIDETMRWVVVVGPAGYTLVERAWFESEMSGPLGYGRLLHSRSRIGDMAHPPSLVLPGSTPIGRAATLALARPEPGSSVVGLVATGGEQVAVASATAVFERLARHYAHHSLHDPLTGLPNRAFLMERLRALRGHDTTLLYIDLDRFKEVNDELGHAAGDSVLRQFADRLRALSRAEDLVVRLGGDEFALLAPAMPEGDSAALARRLVAEASVPYPVRDVEGIGAAESLVHLGASVGVTHSRAAETGQPVGAASTLTSLDVLLKQADLAMYRAKSLGRGRAEHYDPRLVEGQEPSTSTSLRRDLERRLRAAISDGALHLHYQPVVNLPSAEPVGVEALARWEDPDLGSVPPDTFIPLAESTGLIVDLGRWVLREACRRAAEDAWGTWRSPTMSVNVSAVQLREPSFVDDVEAALRDAGLPASRLCLEITETAVVTDVEVAAGTLHRLRDLGVRLALDDFGTGHSSLTLLRRLPLHVVKLDRSMVDRIDSSAVEAVLTRLVIDAAHSLGFHVCGEGVERESQALQLVALGCDSAQGWLFGRPSESPGSTGIASDQSGGLSEGLSEGLSGIVPPVALGSVEELVVMAGRDHQITYVSSSSPQVLGRMPYELVGQPLSSLLGVGHPEGPVTIAVEHATAGRRWLGGTVQALREPAGAVREVLCVLSDVTEKVARDRALAESEELFREAFDNAPTATALSDLEGRMLRVNRAFARLLGRDGDELLSMTVDEVTHPDDRAHDRVNLADAREGRVAVHQVHKRYLHRNGEAIAVGVRAAVVRSADGSPLLVVAHVEPVAGQPSQRR